MAGPSTGRRIDEQQRHGLETVQMGALLVLRFRRAMPVPDIPGMELSARTLVDERTAQKRVLIRLDVEDVSQDVGVARLADIGR